MFYRIYYTSWPQLLEAGRGGFGIVARHREIPTVVAHAAEAASQFAPLRGEAIHRVVYAYRTETAQSGRWHILSRIEDSGSDYTGRTNYLAQHLVASDEVARSLASQGISPAMVMGAPDAWPGFDRQVGFITDPPWQVKQAPPREGYWAHFGDGNTERRFLLAAGSNVTLVYPSHWQDSAAAGFILGLYDEAACGSRADCGWGTTFTTYLEPTDKPKDFCWIGLPADSALLPKLRDTGRPIITETTLPPARPAAPAVSPSKKQPDPIALNEVSSDAAPVSEKRGLSQAPPVPKASPRRPVPTSTPPKRNAIIIAGAAGIAALLLLAVYFVLFPRPPVLSFVNAQIPPYSGRAFQPQVRTEPTGRESDVKIDPPYIIDAGDTKVVATIAGRFFGPSASITNVFTVPKGRAIIEFDEKSLSQTWPAKGDVLFTVDPPVDPKTGKDLRAFVRLSYKAESEDDSQYTPRKPDLRKEAVYDVKAELDNSNELCNYTGYQTAKLRTSVAKEPIQQQANLGSAQLNRDVSLTENGGRAIYYLALGTEALQLAAQSKIWPPDHDPIKVQDWSTPPSPEAVINPNGSLGDNKNVFVFDMDPSGKFPTERRRNDPGSSFNYSAQTRTNLVHLISLRSSGDNLGAVTNFLKARTSLRKTSDKTLLELLDPDNFFKHAKLLPEDSKWILRISPSQTDDAGPIDLTNTTSGTFSLQAKFDDIKSRKEIAQREIDEAEKRNKQAVSVNSFFKSNKQGLVDQLERLSPKDKEVATSLLESLQKIQAPPARDGKMPSEVENITVLLTDALDRAFNDQIVGPWMKLSDKDRDELKDEQLKARNKGMPISEEWAKLLEPREIAAWLAENPGKGDAASAVRAFAYEWLEGRIKQLQQPRDAQKVKKSDVKTVLQALAYGIKQTGGSGQNSVTASPIAQDDAASNKKAQAERELKFLESLGTPSATGSAQLFIQFPDREPILLVPDVALRPEPPSVKP